MGLPGADIIDLRLWKDMLDEVVTFELPSPEGRDRIGTLRLNLKKYGIRGIAYLGSFEEVVILGEDFEGQHYEQEKLITLYNLDFCDEICSSVNTRNLGEKRWRYEAIRTILEDQKRCYRNIGNDEPSYFILLLTVRNQIEAMRINEYICGQILSDTQSYCALCNRTNPLPESGSLMGTHAWSIKAFLYDILVGYFKAPNISAIFFPIIKYVGTPIIRYESTRKGLKRETTIQSPMLHWMIFCKFSPQERPSPNFFPQQFLEKVNSLLVSGSRIDIQIEPGEDLNRRQILSPVDWFKQFESTFISDGRLI